MTGIDEAGNEGNSQRVIGKFDGGWRSDGTVVEGEG